MLRGTETVGEQCFLAPGIERRTLMGQPGAHELGGWAGVEVDRHQDTTDPGTHTPRGKPSRRRLHPTPQPGRRDRPLVRSRGFASKASANPAFSRASSDRPGGLSVRAGSRLGAAGPDRGRSEDGFRMTTWRGVSLPTCSGRRRSLCVARRAPFLFWADRQPSSGPS